jgi:hypothetical protein
MLSERGREEGGGQPDAEGEREQSGEEADEPSE